MTLKTKHQQAKNWYHKTAQTSIHMLNDHIMRQYSWYHMELECIFVQALLSCSIQGKNYLEQAITVLQFSKNTRIYKIVFLTVSFQMSNAIRSQHVPKTQYNKRTAVVRDLINTVSAVYNLCRLSYSIIQLPRQKYTTMAGI